jgi:hypothetical protein
MPGIVQSVEPKEKNEKISKKLLQFKIIVV